MLDRMTGSQMRDLLSPFTVGLELSEAHLSQLSTYLDLLLKWNSKVNLTAVREPDQIVRRHFGESLFAAGLIASSCAEAKSLTDVGSGAGLPGIPIKIAVPPLEVTLIESQQKKATFLREVIRSLPLGDIQVANVRAEEFESTADVVTLRAVESFEKVLPIAERLLRINGTLILLIGSAQIDKAASLLPNLRWETPHAIPESDRRVVLLGSRF